MNSLVANENRSRLSRITCGWKKAELPLEAVRRYWRDVHSPAISRRHGIFEYRHAQFDAVRGDLFEKTPALDYYCPADQHLMWLSDVRYANEQGLAAFAASPSAAIRAHLLADIDLLVDKSTTYRAVGDNACTYADTTGEPEPTGPAAAPTFAIFFRQRPGSAQNPARAQAAFRECLRTLATGWAVLDGVSRVRLSLFDVPDMEAERNSGYPVKTHPPAQQYQALVDLVVDPALDTCALISAAQALELQPHVVAVHAYPVVSLYTFVRGGAPTLIGLRGYAASLAIREMNAVEQRRPALLEWMYGKFPAADGAPL